MTPQKHSSSPSKIAQGERRISVHFRNLNIALFVIASVVMAATMFRALKDITEQVSEDYARLYAMNTAGALSSHLHRDIWLVAKTANSQSLADWFADEDHHEKKSRAHAEMMNLLNSLSGHNLYFGMEKSRREYSVEKGAAPEDFAPHSTLDPDNSKDAWYFDSLSSDKDYLLNVDVDKKLHRKLVWLNYKVSQDGLTLGVLSTGMELSRVAEASLAEYDTAKVRGVIIDEKGRVIMDSYLLGQDDFLLYASEVPVQAISSEPNFIAALERHLAGRGEYFALGAEPTVITLSSGPYGFATIAPISATGWAVVTLFKPSSLFDPAKLLPLLAIMLALLVAVALASNVMCYRFIFRPFEELIRCVSRLEENAEESIYGLERCDEFGILSKTIRGLLDEAHNDILTGLYNRRFMEKNLGRILRFLSRSGGTLSVLMIDVDFFKNYNDKYGHDMGDACLRAVARELRRNITRADDFVARYGGEEFVAVLPNTGEQGARAVAAKLLDNVEKLNIQHEASAIAVHVTVSIGGTSGRVTHLQGGDDFLKRADEAMYISKQNGRNRYTYLGLGEEPAG